MAQPDRRNLAWIGGPLLALISLLVVTSIAEVVLRVQYARRLDRILARDPTRELCTEADTDLIYRYAPNRCGHNAAGYRDRERTLEKPEGRQRLVVLGDSVAVGSGVEVAERFDQATVDALARAGVAAEAVNLARTGYSTSQELFLLETEAYRYAPDLVVWSYVLNDPADPVHHNANGRLGRFYVRPRVHVWHALERLHFKLRERWAARGCDDEFHRLIHCAYADEVAASIARIGELAAQHATPTLFVIHPVLEADRELVDSSFAELHASLAAQAEAAGLAVVDLLPIYAAHGKEAVRQEVEGWFDPWHPNAEGHALAGEAIAAAATPLLRAQLADR
ncbi:MAG: SGNH/GDSL hydrolase family protein [Myxococcota bacterium]